MHIAYEYEVKKQEEKEELREAREREREEKKLQKEICTLTVRAALDLILH